MENDVLHTLLVEYEYLATEIRAVESTNEKVVGFGLTIVGAGMAYGLREAIVPIFFLLPIALIGVFLYGTLQYYNIFWAGGYKRAVEDRVNELLGVPTLLWESALGTRRGRINVSNASLVAVYLLVLVGATAISLVQIRVYGLAVDASYAVLLLLFMALLLLSVRRMFGAFEVAYHIGREMLNLPVAGPTAPRSATRP